MVNELLSHVELIEILQLIVALIGFSFNIWGLYDSIQDLIVVTEAGKNGPRRFIAVSNMNQEALRLLAQLVLAVIGIAAVILPPHDLSEMVPSSYMSHAINKSGLLLVTLILTFRSALDQRDRHTLLQMWIEHRENN